MTTGGQRTHPAADPPAPRSGGAILAQQLAIQGTTTVFCVPGESYLAALDGLIDTDISLVVCRHESGAANMAEAYGKLTGRPGICFVTRGPGATNASIGVHTAAQDSTPMILFVGQIPREHTEREAFQEVNYRAMFGDMVKWVAQIDDPRRIPELVARAFNTAVSGRPGPVVLALPEDVLTECCSVADARPFVPAHPSPAPDDIRAVKELLDTAQRPLVLVGGGGWSPQAAADLVPFIEANALPVATTFRSQDVYDNRSAHYVGTVGLGILPAFRERVREADLVLAITPRLSDVETAGYTTLDAPHPHQTLIHVSPSPEEHFRVYQPDLCVTAAPARFCAAISGVTLTGADGWGTWTADLRTDYMTALHAHRPVDRGVDMVAVMAHLRDVLPRDAIVANGAGNFSVWAHRFLQFSHYPAQLGPRSGAMGYGVPAAVAASILNPDRCVVAFAGDGDFLMTGQELATAMRYDCNLVIVVVNNGMYGTIRMHQERAYPSRTIGTTLTNPDFAAYARSFGAYGEVIEDTGSFEDAFARANAHEGPALLELRVDPDVITPDLRLSEFAP